MSLASEMRSITNATQNADTVMQTVWENSMKKIKEKAAEGKNEICFYDICHPCNDWYTSERRGMLIDKLKQNGFLVKKGIELGKGTGSWETPFVIW